MTMCRVRWILVAAMLVWWGGSAEALAASKSYDPSRDLVVGPTERRSIKDIDEVILALAARGLPILIYVHGRGNEPGKAIGDESLVELEAYGLSVIMLNWDSYALGLNRPVANADDAGPKLRLILQRFRVLRESHAAVRAIPVSILCHSMGNLALQALLESYAAGSLPADLVQNVVLSSADVNAKGHAKWLRRIDFARTVFVTVNPRDQLLTKSGFAFLPDRLGVKPALPLASNAIYLRLDDLGFRRHRYFVASKQNRELYLCRFYHQALTGRRVSLRLHEEVTAIDGPNRMLAAKKDASNACIRRDDDGVDDQERED